MSTQRGFPASCAALRSSFVISRRSMRMYGCFCGSRHAVLPKPTRILSTISVRMPPRRPNPASTVSSQNVNRQLSPSTAAFRIYSRTRFGTRLNSNSRSNSLLTISATRSTSSGVRSHASGVACILMLSVVMFATENKTTCFRKLYTGVGRPFASTPSHCFPMKKFSLARTVSSRLTAVL